MRRKEGELLVIPRQKHHWCTETTVSNVFLSRRTYSTYIGFGPITAEAIKDHHTKRRSTMNSRDAAYDEQILNQVIEQSKMEDRKSVGPRSRKRGTSETSDE